MAAADRTSQKITLKDGRTLSFAEFGDPAGKPVMLFGGSNGRYIRPNDDQTRAAGVRLITVERPGFGRSDYKPGRTILDWGNDIAQLGDALGLARFGVIGASQGGPYGIVAAYTIPERLAAVTLVSAVAPLEVPGNTEGMNKGIGMMTWLATRMPFIGNAMFSLIGKMAMRNPRSMVERLFSNLPPSDQKIMRDDAYALDMFVQDIPEAYRQGGAAMADDMRIVSTPWNFKLEDIRARPIYLWQGEDDPNVPIVMGRYLTATIPGVQATYVPGAGHFLMYSHWSDILKQHVQGW